MPWLCVHTAISLFVICSLQFHAHPWSFSKGGASSYFLPKMDSLICDYDS